MAMSLTCSGILITQQQKKGFLGGPIKSEFEFHDKSESYRICVEQIGIRKVTIISLNPVELSELWNVFSKLDMLLMMFEGNFIPVCSGRIIEDGDETESIELQELLDSRVGFYKSADYTIGEHSSFMPFSKVLSGNLFSAWIEILSELDILHPMVLYSMSNSELPVDCKCAFLIEAFEALAELVAMKISTYSLPPVSRWESKLGKYLSTLMGLYGRDVFSREIAINQDAFVDILVASRNRIAHIKSKQGKRILNGSESVLYAVKLSYLYRIIILSILDIDYDGYSDKVKESVLRWDSWQNALDGILQAIAQS